MITIVVKVSRVIPVIILAAPINANIPGFTSKSLLINSNINSAYNLPNAAPNTMHGTKNPMGTLKPCVNNMMINTITAYISRFMTPNMVVF